MSQETIFDLELIRRYDTSGPRYTSYPTAPQFDEQFATDAYRERVAATHREERLRPLSLYFHIPFCDTVCFYCGCNKMATKDRSLAAPYLARVERELELQGQLFDRERVVDQLHWGGGTPTFISKGEMSDLMAATRRHFTMRDDDQGEYSIEIDPREADSATIALLRELGFNRMSLGVQDFNPDVQRAVNRIQSLDQTLSVLESARNCGFRSVSMDLIYGLPLQSVDTFAKTLEQAIEIGPDRLSVFNYAHLPELFKPQRRIDEAQLPSPAEKLEILHTTIDMLTANGYLYIGMDHFARPDDELAIAQRDGTLYRNFQGYSTHADCDLIGIGATSIGMVGSSYSQNLRSVADYQSRLDQGELPIFRGLDLNHDDLVRRDIITRQICHFILDTASIEERWGVRFAEEFAVELTELAVMERDGLLQVDSGRIEVLPAGRLLIRNICMVFDRYLRQKQGGQRFSRVI